MGRREIWIEISEFLEKIIGTYITCQNQWDTFKAVTRGKYIASNSSSNESKSEINVFTI